MRFLERTGGHSGAGARSPILMIAVLPLACFIGLPAPPLLFCQTELIGRGEVKELRWGGVEKRWRDVYSLKDATIVPGPMGRLDVVLADNSAITDGGTDLLLGFDAVSYTHLTLPTIYSV